ncbi:IS110 family transposase, partial [Paradevosia shaoguanensis]
MTLSPTWIGIDVSKAWLDIASSGGEGVQRIANTMDAIAAFAATLEREGTLVVLEASGVYDRSLRAGLALAGIGHVRVNPLRARDFARASGQLAKTDALDAAMLAEMGRALRLVADPLPEAGR